MLDISQQQFLVLLFMRDTEFDQGAQFFPFEEGLHRLIDFRAPVDDFGHGGTREHAAREAVNTLTLGLVVGIENERPILVVQAVSVEMVAQEECFPKPCRMREVPLGGRSIFHRLEGRVRFGKRFDQRFAKRTGRCEIVSQPCGADVLSCRARSNRRAPPNGSVFPIAQITAGSGNRRHHDEKSSGTKGGQTMIFQEANL